ncbi:hypothetical protein TSUD_153290 [Trifolium subterraneum]|uniref:Uncharacterized protein n=1 Tax=Trifolium subterraneum TaxID=3900 RepID=A0A2Z6ND32_TRISU|nr:hypothetical protein TSUD_153290 [Trifolium subterraneum]
MWGGVISCARENLLPLAREHLLPVARDHLLPILNEAVNMIRDKMADAEGANSGDGTREKIKQLIEASFRIQDLIDEYIIREEQQLPDPGCVDAASDYVKTKMLRLQIVHDIQIIKSQINEMKDTKRTVVSVFAMGGQGKTTLAKKVFDNPKVVQHFDCHVWITVSQQYNAEGLLRHMLYKLEKDPPERINQMDQDSLVDEVRNCLQQKRYVVVFDDVWDICFWDEIDLAMIDNKNGSRIIITTRNVDVVNACKKSAFVDQYELKGLNDEQSLELFNKKAFHDLNGCCPENLVDISSKIVKKCHGLPLAIVVTGGLLSGKKRNAIEWDKFNENFKPKLKEDSVINKILVPSYHDLSYNLKSCLLYFGIYPEDYEVYSKSLIRQWIAEGFVKEEEGLTLEEVAEGYLTELIHRSLVQVVSINFDGRACYYRVHDLVHDMILKKFEDLSFCKNISEDGQSALNGIVRRLSGRVHDMILKKFEDLSFCKNISEDGQSALNGIVRRLSITTNSDNFMESIVSSQVRSLLVPRPYILHESVVRQITTKYRLLKVFDARLAGEIKVPEDLGSLNHLKYFRIEPAEYETAFTALPKSIVLLENLETLDLADDARVYDVPKEICKLRKLRHFLGYELNLVQLKDGIGGMTSLQTLSMVCLNPNDEDKELIEELGKLKQLKELGLRGVMRKHMSVLSSSINKMQQMENLSIAADGYIIDLDLNLPKLQYLELRGWLEKLPEWIQKHQNLVQLDLDDSKLTEDPMELFKSMPNLLSISFNDAYVGETLHFQNGWFKNLKELQLIFMDNLKSILIDQGALPSLERMRISNAPQLQRLPTGFQHLKKLEHLTIIDVSEELIENILLNGGKDHWIFKQVPSVQIRDGKFRSIFN